ncbi:MAG TPA: HAD hydrolase-like protein [Chloroflexi bacterium]|nr:HAD hydrolase-like protein [Chloroflexota bacterium]
MVGDRLDTDIYGAQQIGLQTVLVATGVDRTPPNTEIRPDLLCAHLGALLATWRRAYR